MYAIARRRATLLAGMLAILVSGRAWAQSPDGPQIDLPSEPTASGRALAPCEKFCLCCSLECFYTQTYGTSSQGYEDQDCEDWESSCTECGVTRGPSAAEAITAIWTTVIQGDETRGELDNLLHEYEVVATLNPERNSIQVYACSGLVANIPLAGLQAAVTSSF
jgi:hypothetical protein